MCALPQMSRLRFHALSSANGEIEWRHRAEAGQNLRTLAGSAVKLNKGSAEQVGDTVQACGGNLTAR